MAAADQPDGPVPVDLVVCPDCGDDDSEIVATGRDYDHHCCGDQIFTMVACRKCGTYYLNPRPTLESLSIIYAPEKYYSYSFSVDGHSWVLAARRRRDRRKIKDLLRQFGSNIPGVRVLDIGAGDGALLDTFQSVGVATSGLFGLDIEVKAVESLRARGFQGLLGRVEEMAQPETPFDVITMIQVIEHLESPKVVLKTLHESLRPRGLLLIETPNMASWDRRFIAGGTWGGYHFPRHWTLWTPSTITRLLNQSGFDVISFSTPAAAVTCTWSINHLLQEREYPNWLAKLFSMNNPVALGCFWLLDLLPSLMKQSANMRVIARRRGKSQRPIPRA